MAIKRPRKRTIWTQIEQLRKKRLNKSGKVIKPISLKEKLLRKMATKRKYTTAHGKAVSRGLRAHKYALKKAARNASIKRNREKTLRRLYPDLFNK